MAFNFAEASAIALASLQQTATLAATIGGEDHITAANDALDAAGNVAGQFLTDPAEQQQAVQAYAAAKTILALISAFKKKK